MTTEEGHVNVAKLVPTLGVVGVNWQNEDEETALISAAEKGHYAVVKLLLAVDGVDMTLADYDFDDTALGEASYYGDDHVVNLSLEFQGSAAKMTNNMGQTPLFRAAEEGHYAVVKRLLRADGEEPISHRCPWVIFAGYGYGLWIS